MNNPKSCCYYCVTIKVHRLAFSKKQPTTKTNGTDAKEVTPSSLSGIILSRLNVGKKYHSGKISNGVIKGLAARPTDCVSKTEIARHKFTTPAIQIGKT